MRTVFDWGSALVSWWGLLFFFGKNRENKNITDKSYLCFIFKNKVMKKSKLSFAEGFLGINAAEAASKGNTQKAFDWDKAAQIIREKLKTHPDLKAEAGLQEDWDYTGGIIFEDGKPTNRNYTYLSSNWAKPTLILEWDGEEQEEIECSCEQNERFNSDTKWDKVSLAILEINLND